METDIAKTIGVVTRTIEPREREGRPARALIASRTYDTSVNDLWDAITNPERIPRWLMPITGELRLGGQYQLHGNASGRILRCEPPTLLAVTWEYGGDVSWVDVVIEPDREGARLVLTHVAHVTDELWDQFGPGAVGVGWDLSLLGLGLHVASREATNPEQSAAWSASDEGKRFMRSSSERWADASVAAGTDRAKAAAAAARTTAFYTGEDASQG